MNEKQQLIANIIHDYCEGIQHLEFNKDDFGEMTNEIIAAIKVMDENENINVR